MCSSTRTPGMSALSWSSAPTRCARSSRTTGAGSTRRHCSRRRLPSQQTPAPQRQLGLLGMQERVALVSGTITIESALGRGTSVFVHIPTSRTEDSDDKP
jgi:hypothetical protein